jgi:hypothetical protein
MSATLEQLLQLGADNTFVIAQPGEPIVNISDRDARRKVNGYVGGEITLMMIGLVPALVHSEGRLVWRVPISLATPKCGHLGFVGALDVDARTGELFIPANFAEEVQANARAILIDSPEVAVGANVS